MSSLSNSIDGCEFSRLRLFKCHKFPSRFPRANSEERSQSPKKRNGKGPESFSFGATQRSSQAKRRQNSRHKHNFRPQSTTTLGIKQEDNQSQKTSLKDTIKSNDSHKERYADQINKFYSQMQENISKQNREQQ